MMVAPQQNKSSGQLQARSRAEASYLAFFKRQFRQAVPLPADLDLHGKTAVITGANAGLGFETSRQLLRARLLRLILAVRSQSRGDAAAEKLRREHPEAEVLVWILDMDSYGSVQAFATRCQAALNDHRMAIDIVLLNAGIQLDVYEMSPDKKHERVLQVNYLSTMLLTILLLPVLKQGRQLRRAARGSSNNDESSPAVLSIVSSDMAYHAPFDATAPSIIAQLDDFEERDYDSLLQYAKSKAIQQSFIPRLAELVDRDDVVLNLVNPGLCRDTAFNDGRLSGLKLLWYRLFMAIVSRTVEIGATTLVDAVAVQGRQSHGSFISDWNIKPFPPALYGETGRRIQDTLWEETMDEFEFAGARKIVAGLQG
ncbi:retinol dehydrogenase 12 [Microdochium nivale]|nr:retinol dehydrogenase 12 [Microdochium nivale]